MYQRLAAAERDCRCAPLIAPLPFTKRSSNGESIYTQDTAVDHFSPLLRNEMKIAAGFLMRQTRPLRVRDDDDDLSLKMPFFSFFPFSKRIAKANDEILLMSFLVTFICAVPHGQSFKAPEKSIWIFFIFLNSLHFSFIHLICSPFPFRLLFSFVFN